MKLIRNGACNPNTVQDSCKLTEYECYDLTTDPLELNPSGCGEAVFEGLNRSLGNYTREAQKNGRTLGRTAPSKDANILR